MDSKSLQHTTQLQTTSPKLNQLKAELQSLKSSMSVSKTAKGLTLGLPQFSVKKQYISQNISSQLRSMLQAYNHCSQLGKTSLELE